jgi:hypothetical protein
MLVSVKHLVVRRDRSRHGLRDATKRLAGRLRVVARRRITQRYDAVWLAFLRAKFPRACAGSGRHRRPRRSASEALRAGRSYRR